MYQERQVAEQALRVGVSSKIWAIIISISSCGSSIGVGLEEDVFVYPTSEIFLILALLRYQMMLPKSSIPLECGGQAEYDGKWLLTRTCEGRD